MKSKTLFLLASASLAICMARAADYDWNQPDASTWSNSGLTWWDQSTNDYRQGTGFGDLTGNHNLNFLSTGTILKQDTASFTGGSGGHSAYFLNFAAGTTSIIAKNIGSATGFSFGNSTANFKLAAGSTLNLAGNSTTKLIISSGKDVSNGDGVVFMGLGTFNIGDGAIVRTSQGNSRTLINDGATVNFNTGSAIYAMNGNASDPFATSHSTRLMVHNGTLNVNGGELYLGYRADSAAAETRGYALGIGMNTGGGGTSTAGASDVNATVNIYSGKVYALGDPRSDITNCAGVSFGWNSMGGGTLNLLGGTLITNNIRTTSGAGKSQLNLDGGTLVVSTETVINTGAASNDVSNDNLQKRLDNFITGFGTAGNNSVTIGSNGVTIDTSMIDTSRTNGVATIQANIQGSGTLRKTGANTLLLSGFQSFAGEIIIEGGTLATGNLSGTDVSTGVARSPKILIKNGAVFDTTRRDQSTHKYYNMGINTVQQLITNEGSGKIVGSINVNYGILKPNGSFNIEGDLSSNPYSTFKFDVLGTDMIVVLGELNLVNNVTFDLSDAQLSLGSYNLFLADDIAFGDINVVSSGGYNFSFAKIDNVGGQQALQMTIAIPEPSTYALLFSAAVLSLILFRRRRG